MLTNHLKKWLAVLLALVMILTCAAASANTIRIGVSVDAEAAAETVTVPGAEADQTVVIQTMLSLMNALEIRVITEDDGFQADFDLNGKNALSLGYATDEQGIRLVSTLFPNYVLTLQAGASEGVPAAGSDGDDEGTISILPTTPMTYANSFLLVCREAIVPGEPFKGAYQFDGYDFDTMVPITVDMPAVKEAFHGLAEEMLNDESVAASVQEYAQKIGMDPENLKASLAAVEALLPDTVTAEYYQNGEDAVPFHLICNAGYEGKDQPLISAVVTAAAGGGRTLPVDGEGKTVLALGDLLSGGSDAASGLLTDILMNGLFPLMSTLSEAVPEAYGLIASLMMPGSSQQSPKEKEPESLPIADPSAWKTLADVLTLKTESRDTSWQDGNYFFIFRYAGTEWLVLAAVSDEQYSAVSAVSFGAEDREEQLTAILGPSEILSVTDLSTLAMSQEEQDQWIGKTGQDLLDAGWEYNGYHSDENGIRVYMVNGDFQYLVSFAEELITTQVFGEQPENLATSTVTGMTFDSKSYNFNETDYAVQ